MVQSVNLGRMHVELGVDIADYERAMKQATRIMTSTTRDINERLDKLDKVVKTFSKNPVKISMEVESNKALSELDRKFKDLTDTVEVYEATVAQAQKRGMNKDIVAGIARAKSAMDEKAALFKKESSTQFSSRHEREASNTIKSIEALDKKYPKVTRKITEYTKAQEKSREEEEKQNKEREKSQNGLQNYFASLQGFLSYSDISRYIHDVTHAFSEQEEQLQRLNTQLQLSRRDVSTTSADYQEFARSLSSVSTINDQTIIGMLRQAEVLGLTGNAAKRAVENAIALADHTQMSADSALNLTIELQKGRSEGLEPYITGLSRMTDEGQRFFESSRQMQIMFEAMTERSGRLSGEVAKLQAVWVDLKEEIGGPVSAIFTRMLKAFRLTVERLKELAPATKQTIITVGLLTGGLLSIGPILTKTAPLWKIMLGPVASFGGIIGSAFSLAPLTLFNSGLVRIFSTLTGFATWKSLTNIIIFPFLFGYTRIKGIVTSIIFVVSNIVPALAALGTAAPWKALALGFSGLIKVILGLLNPLRLVRLAILGIKLLAGALLSPFTLILVPIVLIAAALIKLAKDTGGLSDIWDAVKEKLNAFWEWAKPIMIQLGVIGSAAFELIMQAVDALGQFALNLFASLVGETQVDWNRVKEIIMGVLIAVEFGLRNWRQVWDFTIAFVKYKFVQFVYTVIHFFRSTLPYTLEYLWRNWNEVWATIWSYTSNIFRNLGRSLYELFTGLGTALRAFLANPLQGFQANLNWNSILNLTEGAENFVRETFRAPLREIPEIERQLRQEYEDLQGSILESWGEFYRRRMEQLRQQGRSEREERGHQQQELARDHRYTIRQYENLNATLMGTSEALAKILQYREDVLGSRVARTAGVGDANANPNAPRGQVNNPNAPNGGGGNGDGPNGGNNPVAGDCCERLLRVAEQIRDRIGGRFAGDRNRFEEQPGDGAAPVLQPPPPPPNPLGDPLAAFRAAMQAAQQAAQQGSNNVLQAAQEIAAEMAQAENAVAINADIENNNNNILAQAETIRRNAIEGVLAYNAGQRNAGAVVGQTQALLNRLELQQAERIQEALQSGQGTNAIATSIQQIQQEMEQERLRILTRAVTRTERSGLYGSTGVEQEEAIRILQEESVRVRNNLREATRRSLNTLFQNPTTNAPVPTTTSTEASEVVRILRAIRDALQQGQQEIPVLPVDNL